jgi:hypothetical protein
LWVESDKARVPEPIDSISNYEVLSAYRLLYYECLVDLFDGGTDRGGDLPRIRTP